MRKIISYLITPLMMIVLLIISGNIKAQGVSSEIIANLTDVQKYYRAIHVMAMLLVGFGFLMVFVRKYGRSALTATFLLVSISIPLYYFISDFDIFGDKLMRHVVFGLEFLLGESFHFDLGYNYKRRMEMKMDSWPGTTTVVS